MKRALRFPVAGLITAALVLGGVAAQASSYRVPSTDAFDKALKTMPGGAMFSALASFPDDTTEHDRARFLDQRGLHAVQDFDFIATTYARGRIDAWREVVDDEGLTHLQENTTLTYYADTARWATRVLRTRKPVSGGPYRTAGGKVVDGSGIGIAIVDSGIWGLHPDLQDQIAGNYKVVCNTPGLVNTETRECYGGWQVVEADDSDTSGGHGTHVAGIAAGDGTASKGLFEGVASGARLYGIGVGETISVLYALEAFRWIEQNHATVDPPIKVVNNSWGCVGGCAFDPNSAVNKAVGRLVDAGLNVVFAAGNESSCAQDASGNWLGCDGAVDEVSGYAKNPKPGVVGVANYDDLDTGTRSGTLDSSSSRAAAAGPVANFPDLAAPGSGITAPCKRGTVACELPFGIPAPQYAPYYSTLWGTSMAAPHVAGAIALLREAKPSLTPAQIEDVLEDAAHKFSHPNSAPGPFVADPDNVGTTTSYDKGHGLLDVQAALDLLGVAKDGTPDGTPEVAIESPNGDIVNTGTLPVSGSFAVSSPATIGVTSGDGGDVEGPDAADLVSLTAKETADAVRYTIAVVDVTDRPEVNASFRIYQNVDGRDLATQVSLTPQGTLIIPAFAAGTNDAVASSAVLDTANNSIILTVPFAQLGNPSADSVASGTWVASYVSGIFDRAPGGVGVEFNTAPEIADPYTVRPSAPASTAEVALSIDGTAVGSADLSGATWSKSVDISSLTAGTHSVLATLRINGADAATSSSSFEFDRSLAAPVVTAPAASSLVNTQTVQFSGTSAPDSTVHVREAGSDIATAVADSGGTWSASAALGEGDHTVDAVATLGVRASDPSGALTFTVDSLAPAAPAILLPAEGATLNTASVDVSGTAEPGSSVSVTEGTTTVGSAVADDAGAWSVSGAFGSGAHTIVAKAADAAGNISPVSLSRSFTIVLPGPAAPVITSPAQGATLSTTRVDFLGSGIVGSTVTIREGTTVIATTTVASNGRWAKSVTMDAGVHTVNATTTTAADGEGSPSADRTFSIVPDTTAPDKPTISSPTEGTLTGPSVVVTGNAEPAATVRIYDGTRLATSAVANAGGEFSGTTTLATGTRTLTVKAVDKAGNISEASDGVTITVDANKPVVAIDIDDNALFLPGDFEIVGTASDNSGVAAVRLDVFNAQNTKVGTFTATLESAGGTSTTWTVSPTGLAPGRYRLAAIATDVVNLQSSAAHAYAVSLG